MRKIYYIDFGDGHAVELWSFETDCKWSIEKLEALDKKEAHFILGGNISKLEIGIIKNDYKFKNRKIISVTIRQELFSDVLKQDMEDKGCIHSAPMKCSMEI